MGKIMSKVHAQNETLALWRGRMERNKAAYEDALERMRERDAIYNGTAEVDGPYGAEGGLGAAKRASHVYNAVYELIEGQVDSSIPLPRVTATTDEDAALAREVEEMLRMKLDALPFEEFNDINERNTYNQGGDFALVEWDDGVKRGGVLGDLRVSAVHPMQVIPQNGVLEIEDMDYVFVRFITTRRAIKERYGKEVEKEVSPEDLAFLQEAAGQNADAAEELVTLNIAYYKNGAGGIGRYVWAGGSELENLFDYEARRVAKCDKCGEVLTGGEGTCPACGGKKSSVVEEEYEEVAAPIVRSDGSEIPVEEVALDEAGLPVLEVVKNPDGSIQTDEWGNPIEMPVMKKVRIPYYKPRCYPLLLRRNVSKFGSLLGCSDVDVIRPQQDAIKKLTGSMMEKLLKGGSYVTLPAGVKIETSDRQLKVLRIENPAQKALIDVLNIQPNINFDMAAMADQYEKARSALGITSSFQGKADSSASSGVAKQFAAAQTAGRFESKRRMKGAFYQRMFEVMFRFMLAYADGPVRFKARDERGNEVYTEFNRYDFLKKGEDGAWYWDDAFLFSVDAAGGLAQNREAMWNEAEKKYTSGAMGDPAEDATRVLYWTLLEQLQFPLAKAVKRSIVGEEGAKEGLAGFDVADGGEADGLTALAAAGEMDELAKAVGPKAAGVADGGASGFAGTGLPLVGREAQPAEMGGTQLLREGSGGGMPRPAKGAAAPPTDGMEIGALLAALQPAGGNGQKAAPSAEIMQAAEMLAGKVIDAVGGVANMPDDILQMLAGMLAQEGAKNDAV